MQTQAQIKEIVNTELALRANVKDDILLFTKYTFPGYIVNWHHRAISKYLQKFTEGSIKKLMVFTQPQVGKSELCSRRLPAYILGKNPNKKIALAAYSPTHASSFNRDIQRIILDVSYSNIFPQTTINKKNITATGNKGSYLRNKDIFEIVNHSGFLKSVGVGSPLTGTSVDIGIIDDPIKDHVEAHSPVYRDKVWNWYETVFSTRLHNESQQLITLTRWHEDDLVGRLLNTEEDWTVVSLPAIKEGRPTEDDPRSIGEALWPEKHSLERMLQIKNKRPKTFISLYQQRPAPEEGNIIKRAHFDVISVEDVNPGVFESRTDIVIDTAYTAKKSNDPSGLMAYTVFQNNIYIYSYKEVYMEFSDLCEFTQQFVIENGSRVSKTYIEPKASGKSVYQYLKKNTTLNVIEYAMEDGDKVTRANSIEPFLAGGRVFLIKDSWNEAFIQQCCLFPNGTNDEAIDCLVMAVTNGLIRKTNQKTKSRRIRTSSSN